jgi:hypothetical protein
MSKTIKIVNYIEIAGEIVLFEILSEEEKKEAAEKILDLIMRQAGYIKTENKKMPVICYRDDRTIFYD